MALCRRISYLYALALLTVYALFLPLGGYERMMEGKYRAFLLLSLGYVLAMTALGAWRAVRWREPMCLAALAYLALTALSAALSPYGTAVLLGGTRRDGLLTAALYAAVFLLLARHLRPDRRLLYAAAASAALCDLLVLVQLTGRNPLWLYPAGLNYFDGDVAYSGFYAGAAGNIDFTAFLLALCAAAMAAALVRGWSKWLLAPLALTLIWRSLLPLIAERPLLGGGCGTLYLRDVPPFYWQRGGETTYFAVTSAHNEYLGVLVDQGALALLAFLALLALALWRAYRHAESDRCAVAGAALLCYAVTAFFSVACCITGVYLWLLLAMLAPKEK